MISWKYSFETAVKELGMVKKKKQALDGLLNSGKISPSTYEQLNKEITNAITAIEADQKALTEKMTARANELEKQIKSLEIFLADLEIHKAAGEIDEQAYGHQGNAISLGLEATKQELNDIKEALVKLIPEAVSSITAHPASPPSEASSQGEMSTEATAEATSE
jgi:SMC interacting uncharacterized protein involved in chromosome segregation